MSLNPRLNPRLNPSPSVTDSPRHLDVPMIPIPPSQLPTQSPTQTTKQYSLAKKPKYPFQKLVLAGGGLRGIAYIGAFKSLRRLGVLKGIDEVLGCSIGAVMALLIVLGYMERELYDFLLHFDYHDIKDVNFVAVLDKWGIDSGEKIEQFLILLIKRKTGLVNPTFKQLHKICGPIGLIVNAVALDEFKIHFFSAKETPDMPVALAVRASLTLPGLFSPVDHGGHIWVDGGLLNNLPLEYFADAGISSKNILAMRFPSFNNPPTYEGLHSFQRYLISVWACVYSTMNGLRAKLQDEKAYNIIKIPTAGIGTFHFSIPRTKRLHLFHLGETTVKQYFETYTEDQKKWDNHPLPTETDQSPKANTVARNSLRRNSI